MPSIAPGPLRPSRCRPAARRAEIKADLSELLASRQGRTPQTFESEKTPGRLPLPGAKLREEITLAAQESRQTCRDCRWVLLEDSSVAWTA